MNTQYNAQTSPPAIAGGVPLPVICEEELQAQATIRGLLRSSQMTTEGDRPLHGYGYFICIILSIHKK
jgi:hypothetical protein